MVCWPGCGVIVGGFGFGGIGGSTTGGSVLVMSGGTVAGMAPENTFGLVPNCVTTHHCPFDESRSVAHSGAQSCSVPSGPIFDRTSWSGRSPKPQAIVTGPSVMASLTGWPLTVLSMGAQDRGAPAESQFRIPAPPPPLGTGPVESGVMAP